MRYSATTASGEMANIGNYVSYKTFLRKYNELAEQAGPLLPGKTILGVFKIDNVRGSGDTTWPEQKEYFDMAYSNIALLKSFGRGDWVRRRRDT